MDKKFTYAYFFMIYNNIEGDNVTHKQSCGYFYGTFNSDKPLSKDEYCQIITARLPDHPVTYALKIREIKKNNDYDGILHFALEECTLGREREFGNIRTVKEIMTDWNIYFSNYGAPIDLDQFSEDQNKID